MKEDDEDRQISMARAYVVFNEAQIDGLVQVPVQVGVQDVYPEAIAGRFIKTTGAEIRYGGNKACYIPSQDCSGVMRCATVSRPFLHGTLLCEAARA